MVPDPTKLRPIVLALLQLPASWLQFFAGGAPMPLDGQSLDPQVQFILFLARLLQVPTLADSAGIDVVEARASLRAQAALLSPRPVGMSKVSDRTIARPDGPAVPVRIYTPRGLSRAAPGLVYFHGGGFVLGNLDSHDTFCRRMADDARCVVFAVDYRLAPEHPFPAATNDAVVVWRWVVDNASRFGVTTDRVAIGGDSAGGNLAAVVTHAARVGDVARPCFQLLIYPWLDLTRSLPSHRTFGEGFMLTSSALAWFTQHYLDDLTLIEDPRVSPLLSEDFVGLPPTHVVTAGFDPLRDEGRLYADKLEQAGVPVSYCCEVPLVHGFTHLAGGITRAEEANRRIADALRLGIGAQQTAA